MKFRKHSLLGAFNPYRKLDAMIDYGSAYDKKICVLVLSAESILDDTIDKITTTIKKDVGEIVEQKNNDIIFQTGCFFNGDYSYHGILFNKKSICIRFKGMTIDKVITLSYHAIELSDRRAAMVGILGKDELYVYGL